MVYLRNAVLILVMIFHHTILINLTNLGRLGAIRHPQPNVAQRVRLETLDQRPQIKCSARVRTF